jgi:hypothetical protein
MLVQYINIKHNLLHKTWAAGLRDDDDDDDDDEEEEEEKRFERKKKTLKTKKQNFKKQNVYTYIP